MLNKKALEVLTRVKPLENRWQFFTHLTHSSYKQFHQTKSNTKLKSKASSKQSDGEKNVQRLLEKISYQDSQSSEIQAHFKKNIFQDLLNYFNDVCVPKYLKEIKNYTQESLKYKDLNNFNIDKVKYYSILAKECSQALLQSIDNNQLNAHDKAILAEAIVQYAQLAGEFSSLKLTNSTSEIEELVDQAYALDPQNEKANNLKFDLHFSELTEPRPSK
jgi:hypothetical protein